MTENITSFYKEVNVIYERFKHALVIPTTCKKITYRQQYLLCADSGIKCAILWRSNVLENLYFHRSDSGDFSHHGNHNIYDYISLFRKLTIIMDGVSTIVYVPKTSSCIKIYDGSIFAVDDEKIVNGNTLICICKYTGDNVIIKKTAKSIYIHGLDVLDLDKEKFLSTMVTI